MAGNKGADPTHSSFQGDGRGVIQNVFVLLDHVAALEPVRLLDLAEATGMPRPTVHRLLQQLIAVGAVCRYGRRYRLGASLLGLGARVTPERRLRIAAQRPIAELAAATGAAVNLSASIGDDAVYLDTIGARRPLAFIAQPGAEVPAGTAEARAHVEFCHTAPIVDPGGVLPDLSCVAVGLPLGTCDVAVVCSLVAGPRPPLGLLAATRVTAARIAGRLLEPQTDT
jgi:IclR helix-turn-helix domain